MESFLKRQSNCHKIRFYLKFKAIKIIIKSEHYRKFIGGVRGKAKILMSHGCFFKCTEIKKYFYGFLKKNLKILLKFNFKKNTVITFLIYLLISRIRTFIFSKLFFDLNFTVNAFNWNFFSSKLYQIFHSNFLVFPKPFCK